jgi:hypothetical protein
MAKLIFLPLGDDSKIGVYITGMRSGVGKRIRVFLNGSGIEDVTRSESITDELFVASNLNPNTTYGVVVLIFYDDGDTLNLTGEYTTPAGSTSSAELSLTNITSTSFDVEISGMYHQSYKIIVIYLNGNLFYQDPSYRGESETSATISLTGLTSYTLYEVEVHVIYSYDSEREEEILTSSCRTLSGGGSSTEWEIAYEYASWDTDETITRNYNLLEGEVAKITVSFTESGTATFYSESNYDTYACLSGSASFDNSTGKPSNILDYSDDDGTGSNFSFTYEVTAGEEYYLFVRHYAKNSSGQITVYIEPPEGSSSSDGWSVYDCITYNNLSSTRELDTALDAGEVVRITFTCANSGSATFYSEGSLDVIGYLSDTTAFDSENGRPASYPQLAYNDDGRGDGQFSMTYDVTAGTTYYLWVRCYYKTTSGDVVIYIQPPEGTVITGATILASGVSTTQIDAYVTGLDTSYGRNDRSIEWYIDGAFSGSDTIAAGVSSTDTYAFTGLSAGTEYDIYAIIYYTSNGTTLSKTLDVVTASTLPNARPNYFEWDAPKVSGGVFNLTATEWNALQQNINDVRSYKGYSGYSFTTAYRGNPVTAVMYNQCINAINTIHNSTLTVYQVSKGDTITAVAINRLRDLINEVD